MLDEHGSPLALAEWTDMTTPAFEDLFFYVALSTLFAPLEDVFTGRYSI